VGANADPRRDLDEVRRVIRRSGFRLIEADLALEVARLLQAEGKRDEARAAYVKGRRLVEKMGYGRRTPEVEALARELGETARAGGDA
jgi:hypothetical protein